MMFGSVEADQREARQGYKLPLVFSLIGRVWFLGLARLAGRCSCIADQREAPPRPQASTVFSSSEGFGFRVWRVSPNDAAGAPTNGRRRHGSADRSRLEAPEEFALGPLHVQSGFGIGLGLDEAIQLGQRDLGPQVILAMR